ncbi:MAG: 3-isopropylmalate dehydratase small subunit, partial [Alphaproteobacteria bacterium]|nr:3-isopropylmalate dehydratase small subunit [Alphaproteobacteria bacterium]
MEKFTTLTATAAFLPIANIDTDMIIAKQYLKTIKRTGLGKWLFAALRYDEEGNPRADFVLNQKPEAQILLAGENFGCGSSREHAPWSLLDFGIRAVIAPSFADIFYNNAYKNGILLIRLAKDKIDALAQSNGPLTIDLTAQTVTDG